MTASNNPTPQDNVAKIAIGPIQTQVTEGRVLVTPYNPCLLLTADGQRWSINLSAFTASEAFIKTLWATQRDMFTRMDDGAPV